jgi:choline dehydrogenase
LERYDYIVVGGGSAGCVTASRLVREFAARVLLLEAGPADDHRLIDMPAGFVKLLFRPNPFVTIYRSEPQPSLDGRHVEIMQGHVLGGGSSVNAMTYTRGVPSDYARWNEAGDTGWNWEALLPYFKKHEGNQRLNSPEHGIGGPLKVSDAHHPICDASRAFLHTLQQLGVPYVSDVNGGSQEGVSLVQSTTYKGKRCSAARAFVHPVRSDPRLALKCNARAAQILFEGNRAVGVEYAEDSGSATRTAYANNEIILTAGAYASPKLLMLSGIGPAQDLSRLGVDVKVNLPDVGRNMQDHNSVALVARTTGAYGYSGEDRGIRMLANGLQYLLFGSGPVSSTSSEVMAFVKSDQTIEEADLQLYCAPVMIPTSLLPPQEGHGITLIANLVAPKSRGSMRLRSADPALPPLIEPNYFGDLADLNALVRGLRYLHMLTETSPLSGMIERVLGPDENLNSDAELGNYCKAVTTTNFHPVGSCRMGPEGDEAAVLTPDLRVRGIDNLRVFDASMMPSIISANTNAPVMAIADRAVDLMMKAGSLGASTDERRPRGRAQARSGS